MAVKQEFTKQIEGQLAVWQAQVKEYQERLAQAGAQAKADYEKNLAALQASTEQARQLHKQVQDAQEGAWKDMQGASQKAFESLQKGWADAIGRFG